MLGKNVYYLNLSEEKGNVYSGTVVGETISDKGYRVYLIKTDAGRVAKEATYVFADKEVAKAAFEKMMPRAKEMYEIQKKAQAECDKIRDELLGKPEFPQFVKE